ncbi:MAG: alpha/beta hydrolase [Candidatus Caldatribacteriaceae bacterium]
MKENWTIFRQKKDYTLFRFVLDGRVPALLLGPTSIPPPHPALLFLHHYRGSKESIVFSASEMARRGFLVLAVDIEYHGERKREGRDILSVDLEEDRRAMQRTIEDCLTAFDFLERLGEVKEGNMFFLGVSLGALLGHAVCALYEKLRGAAFVVGGGNVETLFRESMLDSIVEIRFDLAKKGVPIPETAEIFQGLNPLNFVEDLRDTPLYFFNATRDSIVPPECTLDLYERIRFPKNFLWFHAEHNLFYLPQYQIPRLILESFSR